MLEVGTLHVVGGLNDLLVAAAAAEDVAADEAHHQRRHDAGGDGDGQRLRRVDQVVVPRRLRLVRDDYRKRRDKVRPSAKELGISPSVQIYFRWFMIFDYL